MNLELYILKKHINQYGSQEKFVFSVVDLDRSEFYPQNFVCVLPRLNYVEKSISNFSKRFGNQHLEIAKKLLADALEGEYDPAVIAEIEQRLKMLKPKSAKVICRSCKNIFETANSHYPICPKCEDEFKQKKSMIV